MLVSEGKSTGNGSGELAFFVAAAPDRSDGVDHIPGRQAAGACDGGLVIADNDESGAGLRAARQSGRMFFMPPSLGEDFNDTHKALGVFKLSQMLRQFMQDTS